MIRRVTLGHFKRFKSQSFELADSVVLAGPNNSGKTLGIPHALAEIAVLLFGPRRVDLAVG